MVQQQSLRPPKTRKKNSLFWIIGIVVGVIIVIALWMLYAQKSNSLSEENKKVAALQKQVDDAKKNETTTTPTTTTPATDTTTNTDDSTTPTAGVVTVAPTKASKTFDVSIDNAKIGTITREASSDLVKNVKRDAHTYLGFNNSDIGGHINFVSVAELWQVNPKDSTMKQIEVNGLVTGISLDEKKIAYTNTSGTSQKLGIKSLTGGADKTYSFDGYDKVGDTLFSPDSARVAVQLFKTTTDGKEPSAVFILNLSTGNKTSIVEKDTIVYLKDWLSDTEIEYSARATNPDTDI